MCLLTTYSTLKCELCICTNRRLLPGSTKIRTKINPCLSKRNPWGTTRSHCWTTTLPWPTTSAKWSSHQALWPRFWANVLSPDFFANGHLSSTSSFFTFFLEEIFHFFGQRPCEHFFGIIGKNSSKTQTAGLPSLLHSFASPADQVVTWESTSCTQQKPAKHKQKHWLKNQRSNQKFTKRGPFALLQQCQCLRLWIAQRSTIGWWKAQLKR